MKNAVLFTLLCLLSVVASAQAKFGHVNTGLVLESLASTAEADSLLQNYQDSLRVGLEGLEAEFSTMLEAARKNQPDMTPKAVQKAQQELEELQQQIQVFQSEGARMFEQRRGLYLTPIVDEVMATIKAYAKTNGYTIIFDSSLPQALLFVDDAADLTANIIAELTKA